MSEEKKAALLLHLEGIRDQIEKGHFLNVHFRAFRLGYEAWQEHIRVSAATGARNTSGRSPMGALLEDE